MLKGQIKHFIDSDCAIYDQTANSNPPSDPIFSTLGANSGMASDGLTVKNIGTQISNRPPGTTSSISETGKPVSPDESSELSRRL